MGVDKDALEKLMGSPRLALYAKRIERVLASEADARRAFYAQVTEGDKAEFINGEVLIHSPVKLRHNQVSINLLMLLRTYVARHDLGLVGHEKMMISLTCNDYEPDLCFFTKAKAEQFAPNQMRFPAPDFVAEILSTSTEANDRGTNYDDYAAHGIREYWIIDPQKEIVEQYGLQNDSYELFLKSGTGQLVGRVITGLTIPIRAIFDEDLKQETMRHILNVG